jgi:DnaJ-class molecular chaperone
MPNDPYEPGEGSWEYGIHDSDSADDCPKCDACGKVADTEDQEPWTAWTSLPLHSSAAVLMGLVKPMTCPRCGGSGHLGSDKSR